MRQPTHATDVVASCTVDGPLPIEFGVDGDSLIATTHVQCVQSGDEIALTMTVPLDVDGDIERQAYDLARRLFEHELSERFRVGGRAVYLRDYEHTGPNPSTPTAAADTVKA